MKKPIVRIYTSVDEFIDREMNAEEFEQWKLDKAEFDAKEIVAQTNADAKAELLERLGINEDEAKLLLS